MFTFTFFTAQPRLSMVLANTFNRLRTSDWLSPSVKKRSTRLGTVIVTRSFTPVWSQMRLCGFRKNRSLASAHNSVGWSRPQGNAKKPVKSPIGKNSAIKNVACLVKAKNDNHPINAAKQAYINWRKLSGPTSLSSASMS